MRDVRERRRAGVAFVAVLRSRREVLQLYAHPGELPRRPRADRHVTRQRRGSRERDRTHQRRRRRDTAWGAAAAHHKVLYEQTASSTFGRSLSLRCPHYISENGGSCDIWRHRSSVCATWFCKHDRGATGERFWMALHQLLTKVEHTLAQWCVVELDVGDAALARLFPAATLASHIRPPAYTLDDVVSADAARELWGRWKDREEEFFEACAAGVERLAWFEVVAIGGIELRALERIVLAAFADLVSETLPARLVLAPVHHHRHAARVQSRQDV